MMKWERFFKGHEISKCGQQLVSVKKTFIEQIISNMRERFPETELLSSFGVLSMRPISLLSSDDLKTWGNEQNIMVRLNLILTSMKTKKKSQLLPHQ